MNTSRPSVAGIFPPVTTPFDHSGTVSADKMISNLEKLNQFDLAGYLILGSTGETVYLSESEKLSVVEAARKATPRDKILMVGTGCESTVETIEFTQKTADAGADIALVITPHYYAGKMSSSSLIHHYTALADASPIPVMIYNVPRYTHVDMEAEAIARCSEHPNIIGMKDTGGNITKIADTIRLCPKDFQVLAGAAGFFFPSLVLGAVGGVLGLANIAPQMCIDLYHAFLEGKWDEAAELQRQAIPINTAITVRYGIAGMKAAMDMTGFYGGPVRSPLLDLNEADHDALRQALHAGGLLH